MYYHRSLALSLLLLTFSQPSWSADVDPEAIRSDKQNNPVTVLQNRYFAKTWRPELGYSFGTLLNEAYTDTTLQGPRLALFFSEWLGLELQSLDSSVSDSDDRKALNDLKYRKQDSDELVSPDPEINRINGIQEASLVFAPFYGKLNLMDSFILYSDLYLTTGMSQMDTDQGKLSGAHIGIGQRFYFTKSLSVRVDFRDRIFTEKRSGVDATRHSYGFDLGLSYFFF